MKEALPRIDSSPALHEKLLAYCRLKRGEIWRDAVSGHRVGVLDATDTVEMNLLAEEETAALAVCDPPYNIVVGNKNTPSLFQNGVSGYLEFSRRWVANIVHHLGPDAAFYVWLGADQSNGLQPFPDFVLLLRGIPDLSLRSFITVRNQRGYGTQKNWMAVRQELLYYVKGNPPFFVEAEYTDIPKILRGYYKEIDGRLTGNLERGKSPNIRAGNVWVDIQQVFYLMEENVPGCYAQKPLKAIERIIRASSREGDIVIDPFAHSGSTLIAAERLGRRCFCSDVDPVYAEIVIRRLERYRKTGRTGWQCRSPFPELERLGCKGEAFLFDEMTGG